MRHLTYDFILLILNFYAQKAQLIKRVKFMTKLFIVLVFEFCEIVHLNAHFKSNFNANTNVKQKETFRIK